MAYNTFDFDVPTNFVDYPKYRVSRAEMPDIEKVPQIIIMQMFAHLPATFPADPLNVFYYVRRGFMPPFVVNYFIHCFTGRLSKIEKFYKALHAIERMRAERFGLAYEGFTSSEDESNTASPDERDSNPATPDKRDSNPATPEKVPMPEGVGKGKGKKRKN